MISSTGISRSLFLLSLLSGCAGVGETEAIEPCSACRLEDTNNFSYSGALDVDVTPVRPLADDVIDWSALRHDLHGHPIDPTADISSARLIALRDLTPDQVADGLANDTLQQADVTLFVNCELAPACRLSDFGVLGNPVDVPAYFEAGAATWLLMLTSAAEPGAAAMLFLDPKEGAAESAHITDASSRLDVDVDFTSLAPIVVAPGTDAITLDWSGLTRDGLGNDLNLGAIDGLFVGRYAMSVEALSERVFDLEALAVERWEIDISDTRVVGLDALTGETPFVGIDTASTWLVALRCSTCLNPTPRFVSFLRAAEGGT